MVSITVYIQNFVNLTNENFKFFKKINSNRLDIKISNSGLVIITSLVLYI